MSNGEVRRRALLIGVSRYGADSGLERLKGPPNDLEGMRAALQQPPGGIFEVEAVLENPSLAELGTAIDGFLEEADQHDELLIYYSGHGMAGRDGELYLTSTDSVARRGSSAFQFGKVHPWARESPAGSVLVVLDCCRAGRGFKATPPDPTAHFEAADPSMGLKVLAAVPGYALAPDAPDERSMSPFTDDLVRALNEEAEADDSGLVPLAHVTEVLRSWARERKRPQPYAWGLETSGPYLAARAEHTQRRLARAGLRTWPLAREGTAHHGAREIRIEVDQTAQLVSRFTDHHPTVGIVAGAVGTGKTWILCDVSERLEAAGWKVVSLRAVRADPDPELLTEVLKQFARTVREPDRPCLLVLDSIEWTEAWSKFLDGLDALTALEDGEPPGVSVLVAIEGVPATDWRLPTGAPVPSVQGSALLTFITRLLSPEGYGLSASFDEGRLQGIRSRLRKLVGRDLWATVRLAAFATVDEVELRTIRQLWTERLSEVSREETAALKVAASFSWYGLWCPARLVQRADHLLRGLGAESTPDRAMVRLNSPFLCRAILARQAADGIELYRTHPSVPSREAKGPVAAYLREGLRDLDLQQEVVTVLSRLRMAGGWVNVVLHEVSKPDRNRRTVWEDWSERWQDAGTAAQILTLVRNRLGYDLERVLGAEFVRRVADGAADGLRLPGLSMVLTTIRDYRSANIPRSDVERALTRVVGLLEGQLGAARWSSFLRQQVLQSLSRTGRLKQAGLVRRLGPPLVRPAVPARPGDYLLVADFADRVARARPQPPLDVLAELRGWTEVSDDLLKQPTDGTLAHLLNKAILARRLGYDAAADLEELRFRFAGGRLNELARMLSSCRRRDVQLGRELADTLHVDNWSRTRYLRAAPSEVAAVVRSLGGLSVDLALRSVRVDGRTVDAELAAHLADTLRRAGDDDTASKLLRTMARLEDQRGQLEDGFAQTLCDQLGEEFLADRLRGDNRISVLSYLIDGYAKAKSKHLVAVEELACSVVEEDITATLQEDRGPRLALALAQDDACGPSFMSRLRDRKVIDCDRMFECMTTATNPAALAAHHELGVQLFPGIEGRFANWFGIAGEPSSDDKPVLRDLPAEDSVLTALRAGAAITTTLTLAGEPAPGERLLEAFDRSVAHARRPRDRIWTNRIGRVSDEELAECIRLLARISPRRAAATVAGMQTALQRGLDANRERPRVLSALLSAVAKASVDTASTLVGELRQSDVLSDLFDQLVIESDLYEQAETLAHLQQVESRAEVWIVDRDGVEALVDLWSEEITQIGDPFLVASLTGLAGQRGPRGSRRLLDALDTDRLRRRIDRHNPGDLEGCASLADRLCDLEPELLPELFAGDTVDWLLARAPIGKLAHLADALIRSGAAAPDEVAGQLEDRFRQDTGQVLGADRHSFWLSVGWCTWVLDRHGHALHVAAPPAGRSPERLHPQVALWAVGWLSQEEWTRNVVQQAMTRLRAARAPLVRPWAAAATLAAGARLALATELRQVTGERDPWPSWSHALDAQPSWILALVSEVAKSNDMGWVRAGLVGEQGRRLTMRLEWMASGWRRLPLEAVSALQDLAGHSY